MIMAPCSLISITDFMLLRNIFVTAYDLSHLEVIIRSLNIISHHIEYELFNLSKQESHDEVYLVPQPTTITIENLIDLKPPFAILDLFRVLTCSDATWKYYCGWRFLSSI